MQSILIWFDACKSFKQMVSELNDLRLASGVDEKTLADYFSDYAKDDL